MLATLFFRALLLAGKSRFLFVFKGFFEIIKKLFNSYFTD